VLALIIDIICRVVDVFLNSSSTFTLLFQDSNGGLEFANPVDGKFLPAVPEEGMLYLNMGDMFARLSNGESR